MFVHVFACKYCINKNICEIGWIVWRTFFKADKVHTVTHRQKRFEMLNKHFKVKCTVNICTSSQIIWDLFKVAVSQDLYTIILVFNTVRSFYSYTVHIFHCLNFVDSKHCVVFTNKRSQEKVFTVYLSLAAGNSYLECNNYTLALSTWSAELNQYARYLCTLTLRWPVQN